MRTVSDTDLLVLATFLLFLATAVLAFVSWRERSEQRRATTALEDQATALKESASALAASARASQAAADELLEARRRAVPLQLAINPYEATPGMLSVAIRREGRRGVVVRRVEVQVGLGDDAKVIHEETYANLYLGGGQEGFYVRESLAPDGRDILTLRVIGTPEGGLEQAHETLFRILPNGPPTALSTGSAAVTFS